MSNMENQTIYGLSGEEEVLAVESIMDDRQDTFEQDDLDIRAEQWFVRSE